MPEAPGGSPPPQPTTEDLRALFEENVRLRRDIERMLQMQQHFLEKQQNGKNGSGKDDQKDQKGGEDKEDGKDKDKKEEPKEPFLKRLSSWVATHPIATIALLAGTVILVITGVMVWRYLESYVSTDDAQIDGHINQIGSRISGTVVAVYVENNRSVTEGQSLVDLDPRDYENALAQARANLGQATAALEAQAPNVPITQESEATNVSTMRLGVADAEAALLSARQNHASALAELRQAEANAANADAEERRYRRLVEKQEVSRELYDQRATTAKVQEDVVASRRAAAEAAAKGIVQREAALAQAQERAKEAANNQPRQVAVQHATVNTRRANVEAARSQVQQALLNLSYCKIAAPVAGIIGDKTVEVGQQVAPGQELLAITPIEDIWVTANFKETQIVQMHPGQRVTIEVDALKRTFNGYVQNMAGATGARYSLLPPENATGNYVKVVQRLPVRIRFNSGQPGFDRLRPGMSVEPKVWVQ